MWLVAISLLAPVEFIDLVELHGPEGQHYWLNPAEITTIREPLATDRSKHFAHRTNCIVVTSNGRFIALSDPCERVIELVERPHAVSPTPP